MVSGRFAFAGAVSLAALSLLWGCMDTATAESRDTTRAVIDVRIRDIARHGSLRLNGPWRLWWSRILDSRDVKGVGAGASQLVEAPHLWKDGPSRRFADSGMATYRLVLNLDTVPAQPTIGFHQTPAAYRIFVNGRMVKQVGDIGQSSREHRIFYIPAVLPAPLVAGRNEIIVNIATSLHPCAGLGTLKLGTLDGLRRSFMLDFALRLGVVGCLLFMAAMALVLHISDTGRLQFLWFSGFCLSAAVATTGLFGINVYAAVDESWSPAFLYAREIGIHGAIIMITGFLSTLFPQEISLKRFSPVLAANALVIVLSVLYIERMLASVAGSMVFTVILLVSVLALIGAIAFAARSRRKYAPAVLASFLPLGFCSMYDMYSAVNTNTLSVSHLGLLVLALGYGYIVARELREKAQLATQRKIELSHAEKLATIGTLTASVAHEINNPNNALTLTLKSQQQAWEAIEPMLDGYARDNGEFEVGGYCWEELREELRQSFRRASGNAARIGAIVRQLREFSRRDDGSYGERVDLNAVIADSLTLAGNLVRKRTSSLRLELAADLPAIRGNHQRLEQVVINILQNAAQAIERAEQAITITTRHEPEHRRVTMVIADEGAGMDAQTLRHVFDPFFTTKAAREGTGLGLSICKRIVEAHSAAIAVDSKPGTGTAVSIHFPL